MRLLCLAVGLICLANELNGSKIVKRQNDKPKFICPSDGKWPHESNCGKFYQCRDDKVIITGWCGPKMSFDADHQRCEMSYNIDCEDGERPNWVPPNNWMGTTRSTTTTTRRTRATKFNMNTISAHNGHDDSTSNDGSENEKCYFTGLMPDKTNCESYYYCKDNANKKAVCIVNQFFDEEKKMCRNAKDVDCGERPISGSSSNRCKSRTNGIYPNFANGCTEFYHCNNHEEVKKGDCPNGLKFNSQTLRCDWPQNIMAPCGTKQNPYASENSASALSSTNFIFAIVSALSICFM